MPNTPSIAEEQDNTPQAKPSTLSDRNEIEAVRIKGVNLAEDEIRPELGQFTALTNWVPEKIYAIHKKRGVLDLAATIQIVDIILESSTPTTPDHLLTETGGHLQRENIA